MSPFESSVLLAIESKLLEGGKAFLIDPFAFPVPIPVPLVLVLTPSSLLDILPTPRVDEKVGGGDEELG